MPDSTMIGVEENLKSLELILSEKTWKEIKTVFFEIKVTTCTPNLNLGVEITAPYSALR